ncbi:carbohydrate-binding family 9-like protein [Pleomorphovibrio marinus]|uniref:carbohydrate-binding family 9-like protein n=1 Tax=Pleomorphovibrio marinus TaxID=2164132 RepID=UPI001E56081D|nr:carbohydrate-binding family 9-like protein [Pleomorphovibrio marinus]
MWNITSSIMGIATLILGLVYTPENEAPMQEATDPINVYHVQPLQGTMEIDAKWNKPVWSTVPAITITHIMGDKPHFMPETEAKLAYDTHYIYGIFRVKDRYVISEETKPNGPVSRDSCVEWFFAPDEDSPHTYFNIEINAGGTTLFHHVTVPRKEYKVIDEEDISEITVATSMPSVISPEITSDTTWIVEYKIPIRLLKKYSNITQPSKGVTWKANFYKTANRNSNPHYITWNIVENPRPDFHLPQYFGKLIFQ